MRNTSSAAGSNGRVRGLGPDHVWRGCERLVTARRLDRENGVPGREARERDQAPALSGFNDQRLPALTP
jgi:hypothetical protein